MIGLAFGLTVTELGFFFGLVIPDKASMQCVFHFLFGSLDGGASKYRWYVRAPTTKEVFETAARVKGCFEYADGPLPNHA